MAEIEDFEDKELDHGEFVSWGSVIVSSYQIAVSGLFFNAMPIILGALATAFNLSNIEIGDVAFAYLGGSSLALISSFVWVRGIDWRLASFVAGVVSCLGLLFLVVAGNASNLLPSFFFIGVSMGALYAPNLTCANDAKDPARAFGILLVSQMGLGALALYTIPAFIEPTWGITGVLFFMIGATVIGLFLVPFIPPKGRDKIKEDKTQEDKTSNKTIIWPSLAVLSVGIFYIGLTGTWAFFERIGNSAGIENAAIGSALSVGLLVGALGAFLAIAMGRKFGIAKPLIGSGFFFIICLFVLGIDLNNVWFLILAAVFNSAWNFANPYIMAIITDLDPSGRFIVLGLAAIALGGAFGPSIAGRLMGDGSSFLPIYIMFGITISLSLAISFFLLTKIKKV